MLEDKKFELMTATGESESRSFPEILSRSEKTILYFYPKDNTPGCTTEAQDFTRLKKEFESKGVQVVGVSKDDSASHEKFRISCALDIDLISDTDGSLVDHFRVMWPKNMYGKITFGLLRSTFLLDKNGNILKEWRNVRAKGHADKIIKEL